MRCHYCEKAISEQHAYSGLQNKETGQVIFLHYPRCLVHFTTFYKTEKEVEALKLAKRPLTELLS